MKMLLSKLMVAVACVLCALAVLLAPAEAASAQEALPGGLESPLVLGPGSGSGQQAAEEAAARLSTPEALAEDARSRTAFTGYKREEAVALAERVFGIAVPHWTPPQDQGSGKITAYAGEHMAEELLPGGQHVLIDSSLPLRSAMGSGQEKPVSLDLNSTGTGFQPANPLVPVVLGKTAAEGVSFEFGLRMTPVAHEDPEAPEVVGDSVFYPGTGKDVDFELEPRPLGVEASWQLLSEESSSENALSFALPAGAQLVSSKTINGAVEVTLEGQQLLQIMPAMATEANGATLPVTYSITGSTLTTHVDLSGNVDYPVKVDPVVWQKYGGSGGFWGGGEWTTAASQPGVAKFLGGSGNTGIGAEIVAEAPGGSWANWSLYAPGFKAGEGSLTRMDVTHMMHLAEENKSNVEAGIVGSENSVLPDTSYTYDGEIPGDTRKGMMLTSEKFEGRPVAFCAKEEPGGYDGGSKPLCNETTGGEYFRFTIDTWERQKYWQYEYIEANTARFIDTSKIEAKPSSAPEIKGKTNVLTGSEKWFGPHNGGLEAIGSDPAFGVATLKTTITNGSSESSVSREYAKEGDCTGIRCAAEEGQSLDYENFPGGLPNGKDTIKIEASDASGLTAIWTSTVDVDNTPPHGLMVTGADVEGETINITEGQAGDQITVEATDGEGGVPSSGIRDLGVEVDKVGKGEHGYCAPGPCTGKATWTLNGRELGAGVHTLTVKATDNAGNEETPRTYRLVVHAASPIAMGPGSVNPQSGDFALESTDVDLKDTAGALVMSQHYDSRNVNEGAEGPLGPEWTIGLGQLANLEVLESEGKVEGVMVAGPEGLTFFTPKEGGGFEPPPTDSSVTLTHPNGGEYVLEDKAKNTATTFTLPEGAKLWMPTVTKTAVRTNTLTDEYKSVKVGSGVIVEPTEELAPHGEEKCPHNIAEMQAGCRALRFYYGKEESGAQPEAKGEGRSEWGWHENRLTKVNAVVWNTSAGKMEEVPVAEFSYDGQGRLRAEWDPRVKPELKTIYGYDSENHVTAASAPGEQPWLMTYGTMTGDPSQGRLIKIMRPKASTALWAGHLPEKTEEPTISGSPVVGNRMAVSEGKWEHALTYGFQWEDCNSAGEACTPIAGATNANYTPVSSDVNHTLVAEVSATNAGGTVTAASWHSVTVTSTPQGEFVKHAQSIDSGTGIDAASCLPGTTSCVVSDSKGNAFYATNVSAKSEATWHSWTGPGTSPSEAVDCPTSGLCLLADGSHEGHGGSLYYASSLGGSWKEAYTPSYGVDAIACVSASLCVDGQDGDGYLRDSTKPASTSWTLVTQGTAAMTAASCLSSSFCALADSAGNVHIAPTAKAIETGAWTQTSVDGSALTGIACPTTSSCLAVDGSGNALEMSVNTETGAASGIDKVDLDGKNTLTGVGCATSTSCVSVDNRGDLLVSTGTTTTNELGGDLTSVSCASKTLCLTANTAGEVIAFNPAEELTNEHEGAQQSPQPGTTLEYDVSPSGSGAPYAMGAEQVKEWAQKDDPAEGFEVFPEEHAQGWPASGHSGASVYYTDDDAQTVNVVAATGGIATTEYNEGDVVRSLSPDNQAKALKESNHAEAAEKLASMSKYNESGQLAEVTGPEHKVKLSNGEEVNARNHTRYFYDEGAPENEKGEIEEYGLITKTTDGALLANGEEKDVRTTLTGYSGQNGLGWTLRAPTSTTTEPNGVDLVSSTKYNANTGAVEETRTPGGNAETVSPPEPRQRIGSEGTGNGQFKEPQALAVSNSSGAAWVLDSGNNRIEKFSIEGTFQASYGSAGTGHVQFSDPQGIALNQKAGNVYVADTNNNRIEELNS
jgi:hypothetical protein